MRILPYRTLENVIEGAVLTFVEITQQKELQSSSRSWRRLLRRPGITQRTWSTRSMSPCLSSNADLKVVSANRSFYEFFHVVPEQTIGRLLYDLGDKEWNIPELRELLEEVLPQETSFEGFEVTHEFQVIGRHTLILNAREVLQKGGKERLILLAMEVSLTSLTRIGVKADRRPSWNKSTPDRESLTLPSDLRKRAENMLRTQPAELDENHALGKQRRLAPRIASASDRTGVAERGIASSAAGAHRRLAKSILTSMI